MDILIVEPVTAHNAGIAPQLAIARHRPGVCEFFRSVKEFVFGLESFWSRVFSPRISRIARMM